MRSLLYVVYLILGLHFFTFAQTDDKDPISTALKSGNMNEISKLFDTSVNIKILNKEDIFNKTQAEIILKEFFNKNPVKSYTPKHLGNSKNGAQYTIGEIIAGNKKYRTYHYFKKQADRIILQEFRIEAEE